jgi:hypothetical protein
LRMRFRITPSESGSAGLSLNGGSAIESVGCLCACTHGHAYTTGCVRVKQRVLTRCAFKYICTHTHTHTHTHIHLRHTSSSSSELSTANHSRE